MSLNSSGQANACVRVGEKGSVCLPVFARAEATEACRPVPEAVEVSLLPQEVEQVDLVVNDEKIKGIRQLAAGHNLARRSWLRGM